MTYNSAVFSKVTGIEILVLEIINTGLNANKPEVASQIYHVFLKNTLTEIVNMIQTDHLLKTIDVTHSFLVDGQENGFLSSMLEFAS